MKTFFLVTGKIVLAIFLFLILVAIVSIPVLLISIVRAYGTNTELLLADLMNGEFMAGGSNMGILMILQCTCMIAAVWIMVKAFERKSEWTLGWKHRHWLKDGAVGSAWGILFMTVCFLVIWIAGGLKVTGFGGEGLLADLLYALILFAFVAISEELLNRGYVKGLLRHHYGKTIAIAVTSLIFAAMHLGNANVLQSPWPILNLILAGVIMGVAREVSNNLWVPIGIHFTWNLFQGNVYGFEVSGEKIAGAIIQTEATGSEMISGGAFGAEGSMLTAIVIIAFTFLIPIYYRRLAKRVELVARD
jgi:membrane protease YdiL (CAAX protease family)